MVVNPCSCSLRALHVIRFIILGIFLSAVTSLNAQFPDGFARELLAEGLDPTTMAEAPDGRIFIGEKKGRIRIIRNGVLLEDPFLTIEVDNYNERGLAGIAFHPDFEQNNFLYVFYTVPGAGYNRISRFTANGDYAIPGSEEVIFELDLLSGTIHNGGAMAFGPDGKLYVATGDGSAPENAQSLNSLLGKILRLNPDGSIPADNPFYGEVQGKNRAIWALGLRNPFTFAIDLKSGRLFANDVGSQYWEEVNDIVRAGNYGWARLEGARAGQQVPSNYYDPLYAYDHGSGCAITGAAFYQPEDAVFPQRYYGKYFFADYCEGYIHVLDPETGDRQEVFATGLDRPVGLLTGKNGDLYYLARGGLGGGSEQDNTSSSDGALWRVYYTGSGAPHFSRHPRDLTLPVGEEAVFEVSATGSRPIGYQWERNGTPIPGATDATLRLPAVALSDDGSVFRCRISNAEGSLLSEKATLSVTTNTRPDLTLLEPAEGATYRAGDTLFFSGIANDAQDGVLKEGSMVWRIDFHHDEHSHPALEPTGGIAAGSMIIPQVGEIDDNVWYRVYLTATDSDGLSQTVFRDVHPEKTTFTVVTDPPGLQVNIDGRLEKAPQTVNSVIGIRRTLSALPVQVRSGHLYRFQSWSNDWTNHVYPFFAGMQDMIRLNYQEIELAIGDGTGLLGEYYQGTGTEIFETEPVLTRTDTVVDFDWVFTSPDPLLEGDNFLARWRGEVLAPMDGIYTFHVISDDGIRLWVDDRLLIDRWVPQAATETTAMLPLEKGRRYPVRLEYFEAGGHAVARLLWSNEVLPRQVIPKRQLFPAPRLNFDGNFFLKLYPSPAQDWLRVEILSKVEDSVQMRIFDATGRLMAGPFEVEVNHGLTTTELYLTNFSPGMYILELKGLKSIFKVKKFAVH